MMMYGPSSSRLLRSLRRISDGIGGVRAARFEVYGLARMEVEVSTEVGVFLGHIMAHVRSKSIEFSWAHHGRLMSATSIKGSMVCRHSGHWLRDETGVKGCECIIDLECCLYIRVHVFMAEA